MSAVQQELTEPKQIQRFLWSQGDYTRLARTLEPAAEALVDALGVRAGEHVVDLAAGNGNVAVHAARRGATVTACDITAKMIELGRARCAAEQLEVTWLEGDSEALPLADHSFDVATCAFGVSPAATAGEMLRVLRPGGRLGIVAPAPGSFIRRLVATVSGRMQRPADERRVLGAEQDLRRTVEERAEAVHTAHGAVTIANRSIEDLVVDLEESIGPIAAARLMVGDGYSDLRADVRSLVEQFASTEDGCVTVSIGYELVTARSRR